MTHTPTPWNLGNPTGITGPTTASVSGPTVAGKDWGYEIVTRGYETLCICPNQGFNQYSEIEGSGASNAALIVHAVNSLPALVKALEVLERASSEVSRLGATTGPQWPKLTGALISARAALASHKTGG